MDSSIIYRVRHDFLLFMNSVIVKIDVSERNGYLWTLAEDSTLLPSRAERLLLTESILTLFGNSKEKPIRAKIPSIIG